jgi:hypothetical protein
LISIGNVGNQFELKRHIPYFVYNGIKINEIEGTAPQAMPVRRDCSCGVRLVPCSHRARHA